ncbi:hypothetical protein [Edaphobacter aggregans]|uniref:hypothetical protein n=1 Tax=Edaphobacter aggregans TaxID=570835 RepID=UPI00054E52C5|nr:hypothetical protein [Edaphobacter aggregans]
MTNFFRILTCSCLFAAMSLTGPRLHAQGKDRDKIKASALKVEMIQSDEIKLPAEFQVALYENLIQQLGKKDSFLHVYRDGDRNAANVPDLVVFHGTVSGFKQGSEKKRQVTTVAGATSITIHCQFIDNQGKVLLERDVNGKVRFYGDNLKATYDFAKKAAAIVSESFSAAGRS